MNASHRRWLRVIASCVVFVAIAAYLIHMFQKKTTSAQATPSPPPIRVVTATAKKGNQPIYLTGLGSVIPDYTVTLHTRVDGELLRFAVEEGQIVSAGQLIAEIDPRPFEVQLLQAEGQSEHDQAILANAKVDLERYRALYAEDSIPRQQYDTQIALVRQSEAAVKADQGPVESAKLQLVYTRITAPITGRIGLRQIDPGNIVHVADQNGLAIITQLEPISVIFNIAQDYLPLVMKRFRAGQPMKVDAFDRDFKTKIATGSLLTTDNQADVTTGTVRFKAMFPNEDDTLFPNQFVNARLLVDVKRGTILIPAAAVQRGPQGTFVYVVKPDETVEVRNVVVGPIEDEIASIDNGLAAGEVAVTEGTDKLQAGAKVQLASSVSE